MHSTGWSNTPTIREHGGYFEAISRDGTPILSWDADAPVARRTDRLGVYYGFKSMNSHIHLLEALTELCEGRRSPDRAGAAARDLPSSCATASPSSPVP